MDKAEREALEAQLSETLGINVQLNEYMPKDRAYIFNMTDNPFWGDKEPKEWLVLPADEAFIQNVSNLAKNVILKNLDQMKSWSSEHQNLPLENLKSQD